MALIALTAPYELIYIPFAEPWFQSRRKRVQPILLKVFDEFASILSLLTPRIYYGSLFWAWED